MCVLVFVAINKSHKRQNPVQKSSVHYIVPHFQALLKALNQRQDPTVSLSGANLIVEEFTLGATVMGVYKNDGTSVSVRLSTFKHKSGQIIAQSCPFKHVTHVFKVFTHAHSLCIQRAIICATIISLSDGFCTCELAAHSGNL